LEHSPCLPAGGGEGGDELASLKKQLEEAEDKMQVAVDAVDFEAAGELQELVDTLTDEIDRLEAL